MKTPFPPVEPLESRIAPAAVTITYTDADGDKVHITDSTGHLTLADLTFVGGGTSGVLAELNIAASNFSGANITFTVTHVAGGDGLANVGYIDAGTNNLGSVTVDGDLGRITAGAGSTTVTAVKSLSVKSLGQLGLDSQQGLTTPNLNSAINGPLGSLTVAHSITGAYLHELNAGIGSVTIGGSLIGGSAAHTGEIITPGPVGPVKIGGDIQGGAGTNSGLIVAGGKLASATVTGSVVGGAGVDSGGIYATGAMGPVKIGGDIIGGYGHGSGVINAYSSTLASATISGSIVGGDGAHSGTVYSHGNFGVLKVGHDIVGGAGASSGYVRPEANLTSATISGSIVGGDGLESGQLYAKGNIGLVTIGHNIQGSYGDSSGFVDAQGTLGKTVVSGSVIGGSGTQSGQIYSDGNLGSVTVRHNLDGGTGYGAGYIDTMGTMGNLTIGGSVIGGTAGKTAYILSSGNMGAVTIGGNLTGGSISGTTAGISDSGAIVGTHGSISSVTIAGSIISGVDTSTAGTLSADATIRAQQQIGALTVHGSIIGNPDGGTGDTASPVVISAGGLLDAKAMTDLAIGHIAIGGYVDDAVILAGYNVTLVATTGSAQIGPVKVGGSWIASDLVAGATNNDLPTGALFPSFGNGSDTVATGSTTGISSRIASITIGNEVFGTPTSANSIDNFGFVAQSIGPVAVGGFAIPIPTGSLPQPIGETGDVDIHVLG